MSRCVNPAIDFPFAHMNISQRKNANKENPPLPTSLIPFAKDFDAKIDASLAESRRWCEQRNNACGATRNVPNEVLSMVFRILRLFPRPSDDLRWTRHKSWISVIYVCRQWRAAALSEPSLWNNLSSARGKWLERYVSLAKAIPLVITFDGHGLDDSSSLPKSKAIEIKFNLLTSPERLGQLSITNCTDHILHRLNNPTPSLTCLALSGAFSIPNDFLGGSSPQLRTFSLQRGLISQGSSWLLTVQNLTLSQSWGLKTPAGERVPLTTCSLLNLLQPLEGLEKLSVVASSGDVAAAPQRYVGASILFPRLKEISLSLSDSTNLEALDLLSHIETPSLSQLTIYWPHSQQDLEKLDDVYSFFVASVRATPYKLRWSGNSYQLPPVWHHTMTLSTSEGAKLSIYGVQLRQGDFVPFRNMQNIRTLEVVSSELLSILEQTGNESPIPYPSLMQVDIPVHVFSPKTRILPIAKRWIKSRAAIGGVQQLRILGSNQQLDEKDIRPFRKMLSVTWQKSDQEVMPL
ncbi:hypothetical protein ONZ45_g3730 [Pleurotus djamor]|nr:hypothetical protein ONZ45_g3730 [Pleurotus djamor]